MPWFDIIIHVLALNVGFVLGAAWCGMVMARRRDDISFISPDSVPHTSYGAPSTRIRTAATERTGSES